MSADAAAAKAVAFDPSRSVAERARALVDAMTTNEKVSQLRYDAPAIEHLGIPEYNWWNEGLHGVARAGRATVFPQAIGLAATFDPALVGRVASAIADEARAKHHAAVRRGYRGQYFGLTCWSPNINIFRDPRWGRGHETFGEDPHLAGRLGVAFVRGLQGADPDRLKVAATPKHYVVHSGPELDRHRFDARASARDMAETYFPAFRDCVQEGRAASVMGAYNRTNGEPCCGSDHLLNRILRQDWGFGGYVVSDCGAVNDFHEHHKITENAAQSAALALKNGCDLNCGTAYRDLHIALDLGLLEEADLDRALLRLFEARVRLGMFDPEGNDPYAATPPEVVECAVHVALSREAAAASLVLLKNENDLLPLDPSRYRSLAVVGPNAMNMMALYANYYGYGSRMTTPLEGIMAAAEPGLQIHFAKGCDLIREAAVSEGVLSFFLGDADIVVACLGLTPELEGEEGEVALSDGGGDRTHLGLPGRQQEFLEKLVATGKPVVLLLLGGSAIDLSWAKENVAAILLGWYPGAEGGHAIADVLFGKTSPSGRLPVTFYRSVEELPPFEDYAMKGRTYRFFEGEPVYRFGDGLSYTTFRYEDLRVEPETIPADGEARVTVEVANTGARAGHEVVQLYVEDVEATVPTPRLHLEGVERIRLEPGERRSVSFRLGARQLACYDDEGRPFVEPGAFRISLGGAQPASGLAESVSSTLRVTE